MKNREIEAKFLDVDKAELIGKLSSLDASNLGEDFFKEMIFYDKAGKWAEEGKTFVRIRETKNGARLTYKKDEEDTAVGTEEIEFGISDALNAMQFLERVGLELHRFQEKERRAFKLADVSVDIDTWPGVPSYVELEGPSEEAIKEAAKQLGFDWKKAVFGNARRVLEKHYKIPIGRLKYFTFDKTK